MRGYQVAYSTAVKNHPCTSFFLLSPSLFSSDSVGGRDRKTMKKTKDVF